MAVANTNLLELLGKQVSFSWLGADGVTYETDGQLTTIVFNLESSPQFTVDDGDFFTFDEITEFQVLDDRSIVDAALTGLITDNQDFIDSLSK